MDNDVKMALESGEAAIRTLPVSPPKKPGFFSKTGKELGRRLAPENVAASAVVAGLTTVGGALFALAWNQGRDRLYRPYRLRQYLTEGLSFPMIEWKVLHDGWASTEHEAKGLIYEFLKSENAPIPDRYAEFEPPRPPMRAPEGHHTAA